jgi:hypothetical protein
LCVLLLLILLDLLLFDCFLAFNAQSSLFRINKSIRVLTNISHYHLISTIIPDPILQQQIPYSPTSIKNHLSNPAPHPAKSNIRDPAINPPKLLNKNLQRRRTKNTKLPRMKHLPHHPPRRSPLRTHMFQVLLRQPRPKNLEFPILQVDHEDLVRSGDSR